MSAQVSGGSASDQDYIYLSNMYCIKRLLWTLSIEMVKLFLMLWITSSATWYLLRDFYMLDSVLGAERHERMLT